MKVKVREKNQWFFIIRLKVYFLIIFIGVLSNIVYKY